MTTLRLEVSNDGAPFDNTQKELFGLPPGGEAALTGLLVANVKDTNKGKSGKFQVLAIVNGVTVAAASNLGKSEYRRIEDRVVAGLKKFRKG